MAHPHGTFSWTDVMLPDPMEGAAFYRAVFGWEATQSSPDESMPYWMLTKDGRTCAGLGGLSPEQQKQGIPPMWSSYVTVDDIDAAAAKAEELGATIVMPPTQVFTSGKLAFITDPGGAGLAMWEAGDHTGADQFNTPGFMSWNELATRDVEGSVAFYRELFGWSVETQDMGQGMEYTIFKVGDQPNAGAYDASLMLPDEVPAHWGVYFTVEDCDATAASITEHGGSIMREPSDIPVGRMAVCADPQGATFMIIALAEAA